MGPSSDKSLAILIVAAGRGVRAGAGTPKQYRPLAGRPVLSHTLDALARACEDKSVPDATLLCVIHPDDEELYRAALAQTKTQIGERMLAPAHGGATRQASVAAGLERLASLKSRPDLVLIHDAARPFVTKQLVARACAELQSHEACAPGAPVLDSIKEVDDGDYVRATLDREKLRAMQTPQGFAFATILDAHRRAAAAGLDALNDDTGVAAFADVAVHIFPGDAGNVKITQPEDFVAAEERLAERLWDVRTGQGFDVHAFAEGDKVWLGGVAIPHKRALLGHSDADVLMHAITDAILGALADGDIGSHFPPSDPQWKGAASDIFLRHAVKLVRDRAGVIAHIDGTVICEEPKVGPHREAIRDKLAEIMDMPRERVAIKATTSEQLGFTGRREGIAAMAIATIRLPEASVPAR